MYEIWCPAKDFWPNRPSGPIKSTRCNVREPSVCVYRGKSPSHLTGDFWSKSVLLLLAYFYIWWCFWYFLWFFCFNFWRFFGSFQVSLLCIVGELAGGGSVAVAVSLSDKWQVTCDRWRMTHDTWHFVFFFSYCLFWNWC